MTVKDFLEMDIVQLAELYEGKKPAPEAKVKAEPKAASTAKEEPEAKPKYNGEGNPMKLRKMCTDRGIEAPTKKNAAFYVDLLKADDAKAGKSKPAAAMNKPEDKKAAKPGAKLSEETYDKNQIYTEDQLKTVTARGLYNICRNVFDIPRENLKTKEDSIREILKAQGGGADEPKVDYSTMGAKALYALCVENGIPTKPKQAAAVYRELLEANDAADEPEPEEESDDEYAGLSELELFKLCKKIDPAVKTRQKREYYLDILNADEDEEEAEDEWGEEWGSKETEEDGEDWDLS